MNIENWPLVQDLRKLTNFLCRIIQNILQINKETPKDVKHVIGWTWKH